MCFYYKKINSIIQMIIFIILFTFIIKISFPISVSASEHQPIMGETIASKEEMLEHYNDNSSISYPEECLKKNINLEKFLHIIIEEAQVEGIRENIQLLKGNSGFEALNQEKINQHLKRINNKDNISTPKMTLENLMVTEEIETLSDLEEPSEIGESTPVEVKILTIDGSSNVGDRHRIRSSGISENGVLYQFWIKDLSANKWTMIQDYSNSGAPWTPTKPGKYLYGVHIKDEKSNERLDAHLYKEVTIKGPEVKTLTIDGSGNVADRYRIRSLGISQNGVLYQFWIKDLSTNRWTMIQDYSKSSASWTPTKPGKYLYGVHIKDEKSDARLDAHLYKEVMIEGPEIEILTIEGPARVGSSHRIRSYGTSRNGVLYQFWIKDLSTNKWTMIQDYSKSGAPWTPTKPGNYLYGVHIKDEKSNAKLDAHLYKNITITNKTIMLDPGHGGKDPGAHYDGTSERNLNLIIANKVADQLRSQGYNVVMSRTTNNSPNNNDLYDRAARANAVGADIYVSIHHNAMPNSSSVSGIESYYYIPKSAYPPLPGNAASHNDPKRLSNSLKLANSIQNELIKATGANNRGVKRGSYVVVRETQMPAVLLELGYMTNKAELKRLKSDSYQNTLANAIVQGINDYYGK